MFRLMSSMIAPWGSGYAE